MTSEEFIEYVEKRIHPFRLLENGRAQLSNLLRKYPENLLLECVDIGVAQYFRYDENDNLIQDSVSSFLSKLGGIAYNKSRNPIDQEISHIRNKGKNSFAYWNDSYADNLLVNYGNALRNAGWSDAQIAEDLQKEVLKLCNSCRSWTQWRSTLEKWIQDIEG